MSESDDAQDGPLVTDRPDFTESSTTVGRGRVQLEAGYTFVHDNDSGVEVDTHVFGEQLWRIGILADWLELRISWAYFSETTRDLSGGDTVDGGDDLLLGCKIALTEQAGYLPEMAILPQAFIPTGAGVFSNDQLMPGVNWLYSWELNDCLSIAGNTQGIRARDGTGHYYVEFAQSLAASFSLGDQLGAYVEWFGFFPHSAREAGIGPEHFLDGGFTYLLNNDFQLDIRAGFGLNDPAADFFTGAGFSYRW